ncbi:MAG TPA: UDP-N-acetylmuramoyl-L-alanine--D-glutamate ligase [Allosphingosinicella sp.]|nr:UDP-N-acetylmuramoyl-L-alanine--D-glutamate ligase [Allosphingosinicella sp.]
MIGSSAFSGRKYAVYGLARSGMATVEALLASGAEVMAWDQNESARDHLASLRRSRGEGDHPKGDGGVVDEASSITPPQGSAWSPSPSGDGEAIRFADPLTTSLDGFDGIVVSPGVPLNRHPIADRAREAGVPLIGDIELFALARASLPPHRVVGITGTNGKSTTTALVHHILVTAGIPTTMAGNIGFPILGQEPLPAGGVYVLELSSYQLDLTHSLDCEVAVLLNVSPDHLDRYDGFEAYRESKLRLFRMQSDRHLAVYPFDSEEAAAVRQLIGNRPELWITSDPVGPMVNQAEWPSLQGPHNRLNASAAVAVCAALDIPEKAIAEGLRTYPGLPHRMERVAEKNGVLFVNDSKATNPTSAAPALAAYPAVHWILGGLPKSDDLDACEPYLDHVRAAYTIGEAGPMFARLLRGHVPVSECEMLFEAVAEAAGKAKPGEVVLLSPACASFDQFRDYEARGDAFRAAVEAL